MKHVPVQYQTCACENLDNLETTVLKSPQTWLNTSCMPLQNLYEVYEEYQVFAIITKKSTANTLAMMLQSISSSSSVVDSPQHPC